MRSPIFSISLFAGVMIVIESCLPLAVEVSVAASTRIDFFPEASSTASETSRLCSQTFLNMTALLSFLTHLSLSVNKIAFPWLGRVALKSEGAWKKTDPWYVEMTLSSLSRASTVTSIASPVFAESGVVSVKWWIFCGMLSADHATLDRVITAMRKHDFKRENFIGIRGKRSSVNFGMSIAKWGETKTYSLVLYYSVLRFMQEKCSQFSHSGSAFWDVMITCSTSNIPNIFSA